MKMTVRFEIELDDITTVEHAVREVRSIKEYYFKDPQDVELAITLEMGDSEEPFKLTV